MEKLSCDSRVKCRTASSSPTSRSCGGGARQRHAGPPRERGDELAGARVRGGRGAGEALWTHQRHVDGGGGHSQALVGADVGSRLGAADVLLARLQREREALAAGHI